MEVIISLITVIAVILLAPFVRFFVKRISFYFRLRRVCKKIGARCYGTKPAWIFSTRKSSNCDFYVEMGDVVYSVKFAECIIRRAEMTFVDSKIYYIKNYRWCFMPYGWMWVKRKPKKLPEYNFVYKLRDEFITKNIAAVLLILPLPVFLKHGNLEVGDGTVISEQYAVYSGKGFLNEIKQQILEK